MNNGWIKLHRKFLEWEWYLDINTSRLFIHLLLLANHEQKKWKGRVIDRGQLITGLTSLSKQTGLTIRELRTSFNRLKSTGEVTYKTTNKFRIVTLVKYSEYQSKECKTTGKTTGKTTSERQANDSKQEYKNDKKDITPIGDLELCQTMFNSPIMETEYIYPNKKPKSIFSRGLVMKIGAWYEREAVKRLEHLNMDIPSPTNLLISGSGKTVVEAVKLLGGDVPLKEILEEYLYTEKFKEFPQLTAAASKKTILAYQLKTLK
jgi:hypothetical protein